MKVSLVILYKIIKLEDDAVDMLTLSERRGQCESTELLYSENAWSLYIHTYIEVNKVQGYLLGK